MTLLKFLNRLLMLKYLILIHRPLHLCHSQDYLHKLAMSSVVNLLHKINDHQLKKMYF